MEAALKLFSFIALCATPARACQESDSPTARSNLGLELSSAQPAEAPNQTPADSATPDEASARVFRRPQAAQPRATPTLDPTKELRSSKKPWGLTGVVALAVVLALILLTAKMFRRCVPGARVRDAGVLCIAARAAVGPKQSLALIQVGRRRYVLASVCPERVCTLADIHDADEVAELAASLLTRPSSAKSFESDLLSADARMATLEPSVVEASKPSSQAVNVARRRLLDVAATLDPSKRTREKSTQTT